MPNYMVLVKNARGRRIVKWFNTYADSFLIYERVYDDEGEHYEFLERR